MDNYRVSVTPSVLARFSKHNQEVLKVVELENGVMYLDTGDLMELDIPYIHSDGMTTAQPKEVLRIITENSIELKNHFDLIKRIFDEVNPRFYCNEVKPDNKYAEIHTFSMVIEFMVKNFEKDTDTDFIINNTQDHDYDYFLLKKAGLRPQRVNHN